MKCDIDSKGELTITPESGIEKYALKKWWDNYMTEGGGESVFHVDITDRQDCFENIDSTETKPISNNVPSAKENEKT